MSPTVLRSGKLRFFFFSREELRMLEPEIALAQNQGLKARSVFESLQLIREHEQEIRRAWQAHFGR